MPFGCTTGDAATLTCWPADLARSLSRRPAEGTNLRAGRSTAGNATCAGEGQRRRGTGTGCSAPPGCDELAIDPQRIVGDPFAQLPASRMTLCDRS
jgi:hypothetical protein